MSCPHSLKSGPCSQCIADAPVQRVDQVGSTLIVDGVEVRDIAPSTEPNSHQPRKQRRNRGKR